MISKLKNNEAIRFGIRPDDIELSRSGSSVKVSVFENLGEEKRISVYLKEGLYLMLSILDDVRFSAGNNIKIKFKEDKVHLFKI